MEIRNKSRELEEFDNVARREYNCVMVSYISHVPKTQDNYYCYSFQVAVG